MPQLKIGIQLASLRLPFKKALLTAAELGADGVEIDARHELRPRDISRTGLRQLRKMLDDWNMRVCAVRFPTRRGYDIADDLDRRIQATKEAMQFAYELGAPVVVNQIGHVPPEAEGDSWNVLIQALSDLGMHGQRVGALLAAETGAEPAADLAKLIAALPVGSLGVNFDPGNLIVHGFSAADALAALGEHVLHVHARDAVRDRAQGRGLETQLGRGSADFPELIGTLEEHGYQGYFTLEREQSEDPLVEFRDSIEYLRRL